MRGRFKVLGGFWALAALAACGSGGGSTGSAPTTSARATTSSALLDDVEGIEARLIDQMKRQSPDFTVGSAQCPEGPPEGAVGATAICTVQVEGVDVPFTVTLLADNPEIQGGAHNYSVDLARPMVDIDDLVTSIRTSAAAQLEVAPTRLTIDCGAAKVRVLDIGGTIPCTVVNGATTRRLVATVTDSNGSVSVSEPAPPKG